MAEEKLTKRAHNFKDLTGQRFGRLIAVSVEPKDGKHHNTRWHCICDCGGTALVTMQDLRRPGGTISCGCYHSERTREAVTTHGMTNSREYEAWCTAKKRCYNPNSARYKNYGARGIAMCAEWLHSFEQFFADMGPCPEGMQLDRKNNDGNYDKSNCHWTDRTSNMRNRQNAVRVTHNGQTLPLKEWAERLGIKYSTLWNRYKQGIPLFAALAPHSGKKIIES